MNGRKYHYLPPIRVEPEVRDELERIAAEMGQYTKLTDVIRQAVSEFIERHTNKGKS